MRTVGAHEAKTHFSELLAQVANGETVEITRHGVPVARMVPVRDEFAEAAAAIEEMERIRREYRPTLGGITIKELIEEGRE